MLQIKGFTKKYGDFKACDNVSFEVKPGQIMGFIGPNGAGKSTTIKSVCGILDFDAGEITIDGKDIKKEELQAKSQIAYIPDNPDIYDFMTGQKYIDFVADIFKIDMKTRSELTAKYAHVFDMEKALNQTINTYSHGMKQKLAIISALVHNPKLLILDEPFVGLDPIASHKVKEIFKEYTKNGGAILFSTHVLEVAEKLCTHITIIKNGKIVVKGKTSEVIKNTSLEKLFLELSEKNG